MNTSARTEEQVTGLAESWGYWGVSSPGMTKAVVSLKFLY